ncbi:hypothetical protein ACFO1B_47850 [Dactylosporangium siamense]|nr:hypothetical protein [Dactylosporangium siamense]
MTDEVIQKRPAPRPVRQAFWLAAAGFLLVLGQSVAAAVVLAGFDDACTAVCGPLEIYDISESIRFRLAAAVVLAGSVALLLGFATLTVPRRRDTSRSLVGGAALLSAVALLLGVVFSPENLVQAQGAAEVALYETLLPVWFTALSSGAVVGAVVLFGIAFARMGRQPAVEYYLG